MQLEEVQNILYDMMCVIDDIFKKEEVPYVLCGGTMLGAVRHQGFIPWDDDMDIVIKMDDFKKAMKALKKNLPDYMRVVTPKDLYPNYYDFVYRIQDTRYPIHEHTEEDDFYNDKLNCVSIDIFLTQETADSLLAHKLFILRQQIIYGLAMGHRYKNDKAGKYTALQKAQVALLTGIGKHMSMERLYRMYWAKAAKNKGKQFKYYMMVNDIPQNIVKIYQSEWIRESVLMPFRDRQLPVVKGYHQLMTAKYGDYMTPVNDSNTYIKHVDVDEAMTE